MKDRIWGMVPRMLVIFMSGMLVLSGGILVWGSPVSDAERAKKAAEARQEAVGENIRNMEVQKSEMEAGVQKMDGELTSLLVDMNLLKADMDELQTQIDETDKEYQKTKTSQERQYGIMKKRIQYLYEEGEVSYLDILLKSKSIDDIINGTEYFRQMYEYDKNMILKYEEIKNQALMQKEVLEAQKSDMEVMEQEYGTRKTSLQTMIAEKEKAIQGFDVNLTEARKEAAVLAQTVQQKTEEIRILRAEEARKREEQRRLLLQEAEARRAAAQQQDAAVKPASEYGPGTVIKSTGGSAFGRQVADYALQFVGNPYVWGGTSLTKGADCSGFTQSVYRQFGVNIPRTSAEQAKFGKEIAYEDMEPGDLICYPGHVSMYIGNGQIVHARSSKAGIRVDNDPAYRTIVSIRRPW